MQAIDELSESVQEPVLRRLLVAVDDSDTCEAAVTWAVKEVWRHGDELHLVHAIQKVHASLPSGAPPVDFLPQQDPVAYKQQVAAAEAFIAHRFLPRLSSLKPPPVVHIVKADSTHESIGSVVCRKAEALQAAALVMASHTRSSLQEFLVGSVTSFCTQHCKRPVFVVK